MKRIDAVTINGFVEGQWVYCIHCERAYKVGEFIETGYLQLCPYSDCDGDTVNDAWPWSKMKEIHPDLPSVPEKNIQYPMY